MDKRVTVKQVAAAAGVSIGTASNALRGVGQTAPETSRRVLAAARRLGYAPDPAISIAMASIRSGTFSGHGDIIAFVTSYTAKDEWRERPVVRRYWEGAHERASELGFHLEPYWLREKGVTEARHSQILFNRGVRGLILAPHPNPEGRLHLEWEHFATVAISRSIAEPLAHRVVDDHFAIMRLAMQRLFERGYRRIGLAMSRARVERTGRLWLGSYLAYQQDLSSEDRLPVFQPGYDRDNPRFGRGLLRWFEDQRPDAIVGLDPPDVELLAKQGWQTPRDYGYASLALPPDDARYAGVEHNAHLVGRTAVGEIVGMLRSRDFGLPSQPHVTLIGGVWREGPTVLSAARRLHR